MYLVISFAGNLHSVLLSNQCYISGAKIDGSPLMKYTLADDTRIFGQFVDGFFVVSLFDEMSEIMNEIVKETISGEYDINHTSTRKLEK